MSSTEPQLRKARRSLAILRSLLRGSRQLISITGIRALLEQVSGHGSRSTVLKPLGWALALLIPATMLSAFFKLDVWLTRGLGAGAGLSLLAYLVAYFFCLVKDREALRSERYSIQKLAIERRVVGDDTVGLMVVDRPVSPIAGRQLIGALSDASEPVSEGDK